MVPAMTLTPQSVKALPKANSRVLFNQLKQLFDYLTVTVTFAYIPVTAAA
jgi:hypothetical protein